MLKNLPRSLLLCSAVSLSLLLNGCSLGADRTPLNGVATGQLNKTDVNDQALASWSSTAALAVYNYDYTNYTAQLQTAAQYFTPEAWQTYFTALSATGNLTKMAANKTAVSAVVSGAPVIVRQGELASRYSWHVKLPVTVTYQSTNDAQKQALVIDMLVIRASHATGTRSLAIKQFIATAVPQAVNDQSLAPAA